MKNRRDEKSWRSLFCWSCYNKEAPKQNRFKLKEKNKAEGVGLEDVSTNIDRARFGVLEAK